MTKNKKEIKMNIAELHQTLEAIKTEVKDIPLTIDGVTESEDDELQQVLSNLEQSERPGG